MKKYILLFPLLVASTYGLEITRHGITWTISGSPTNGTYANGDPWVVGPITITAISPTPSAGRNGTVVNPPRGRTQGYDNRLHSSLTYSETLNVGNDLPLVVANNSSVVSSISTVAAVSFEQMQAYAVLTVVASNPGTGKFRPAYIGGDYSHPWGISDLNYDALADMSRATVSGEPTLAEYEGYFNNHWYEGDSSWTAQYFRPSYMTSTGNGYGKSLAIRTGTAALLLNLDFSDAEKETLLIHYVQHGIDLHGIIDDGGSWSPDGGHKCGKMLPAFVAAMVLNDAGMKANMNTNVAHKFQETQQTFYVAQSDVDATKVGTNNESVIQYESEDIGKPEWGVRHHVVPSQDNAKWDALYRDSAGSVIPVVAAVVRIMDGLDVVNWPALQDYAQRHVYYRQGYYTNPIYYNGYDDGDAYGEGDTGSSAPFASNEVPSFHNSFFLSFEDADPVGSGPDVTPPTVSNESVIKTDTAATITWNTNEGATSLVEWDTDSGAPYASSDSVSGYRTSHSVDLTGPLTASTTYYYRIVTEDSSGNETIETEGSFTTNAPGSTPAGTPTFSPDTGSYWATQSVTISATPSDSIEYTLDGSAPDGDDLTYSSPVSVSNAIQSVRLRAVASGSGLADSSVATADYGFSPWFTTEDVWENIVYPDTTTAFTETIYITLTETEATDLVFGWGLDADAYNDLAIMGRFAVSGFVEARNGGSYGAENALAWTHSVEYTITVSNVVWGVSYDLTVTPAGGSPVVIADDYAWRSDWTGSTLIDSIGLLDSLGSGAIVSDTASEVAVVPDRPFRTDGSGRIKAALRTDGGGRIKVTTSN